MFKPLRIVFLLLFVALGSCARSGEKATQADFENLDMLVSQMLKNGEIMSDKLDSLAHYYQDHINRYDSLKATADYGKYRFEGPFSTNPPDENSLLSSVIILNTTPDREKALEEVAVTNFLDEKFAQFYKSNSLIAQVYSNSSQQVSRVFPSYDHKNIVDPDIDVTQFNFFYAGDETNNPSKGIVWIQDAYIDPAGRGWIVSLVHPIFRDSTLFAVLGADFTVDNLIDNYLEDTGGEFLLVNGKGDIIGGKSGAIELLSLPPLKNHVYRETVKSESFRISDFNLFNSKSLEVRKMSQQFLLNKAQSFEFEDERGVLRAICRLVPGIDWYLIQIFPSN